MPHAARRIRPLDTAVVNKIAAGEIIVAPANALKELLENCIDAHATSVDVLLRDGGIRLLQVADNGSGIHRDDLPLLCQRFTTSKLRSFEDLDSIATYGFRGEALASISHIARVTVTTKTPEDRCAWKVSYAAGAMLGEPAPTAAKNGTTILVEDLFYNIPSRLRALRSANDEYNKILDVVGKYSVHCKGVGFTCKKFGNSQFALAIKPGFDTLDRIRTVYGTSIAKNIVPFEPTTSETDANSDLHPFGLHFQGQITNLNFESKKSIPPIFFINNRLVACDPLRRSLQHVYQTYLPKGNKPFIYLSLTIKPENVDVNVHPTKREVRFLNQDEIIESISLQLQETLTKIDTSRTFKTSTILTGSQNNMATSTVNSPSQYKIKTQVDRTTNSISKPKIYEHNLIRTDSSQTKITSFLKTTTITSQYSQSQSDDFSSINNGKDIPDQPNRTTDQEGDTVVHNEDSSMVGIDSGNSNKFNYTIIPKKRVEINLTSVRELREEVDRSSHRELTNIFANLTYVGVVDEERRLAAIQHDLKLFLIDYGSISNELFYQIGLTDFANFGKITLEASISNDDQLKLINLFSIFGHLDEVKKLNSIDKLWNMREMLQEYFSIELVNESPDDKNLSQVQIKSIPLLLKGYNPPISKLPYFLYRMGNQVNWENEKDCFHDILKQIALFYIPEVISKVDDVTDKSAIEHIEYVTKTEENATMLENVLFPCIKRRLLAPRQCLKDVVEIANLPGLYKVFERC